jgi:hypothetical protein
MLARGVDPEYLELVEPDTLLPCEQLTHEALLLIAARIGETRLIDNAILRPATAGNQRHATDPSDAQPQTEPHSQTHPGKVTA